MRHGMSLMIPIWVMFNICSSHHIHKLNTITKTQNQNICKRVQILRILKKKI